jgi:quinoprotein glucose dehydrogenase
MKAEAIATLSTWAKPSVLDRVDGRYRGVIQRDPAIVKNKARDILVELLKSRDMSVRISAVRAIGKLGIAESSTQLHALLKNDQQAEVRVWALKALASMQDAKMDEAIKHAMADKDKTVRIAGIALIDKLNISKQLMASLLSDVINTKTTEEKQASLITLGKLPVENTGKIFDGLLGQMAAGKLPPDIHLELGEAIDSSGSSELIGRYKQISNSLSPDALLAAYMGSLYGGDAERGGYILYANESAQCLRCHSFNDVGGTAGPRLNGVGSRLTREQILEALVNPSARLAPGFGVVTLELKGGKSVSGILEKEDNATLTIKSGGGNGELIAKDQIVKRINAASSMPEMKNILSKKQIRDVVSFLSVLKEDK